MNEQKSPKVTVISVDPAPKKTAVIFDGKEFTTEKSIEMSAYCENLRSEKGKVLLCWDAPLSGPPLQNEFELPEGGSEKYEASYSQRVIERFFSRASGKESPSGISTLPYSGCSHWAISQACLGLPRVGEFVVPIENLPFQLITNSLDEWKYGVVEIHPALAIWLWCKDDAECRTDAWSWYYKGNNANKDAVERLWGVLKKVWKQAGILELVCPKIKPKTDDELDALVGWVLGSLLVSGEEEEQNKVLILGNENTGCFLLPKVESLEGIYSEFLKRPDTWK